MSDTSERPPVARRRKRPDIIADAIRARIMEAGLSPGERVPAEWMHPDALKASRGTLREAMKVLEFQGLVTSKTGPGGGLFVSSVAPDDALRLLDNLFLFDPPSISDIYSIRKFVEPELAADAARGVSDETFQALQATIRLYEDEPRTAEDEYAQRMAELDFHAVLARNCSNRVLGFIDIFLLSLLRDMTVCREIYQEPNPSLRETGLHYQVALMRAVKARDPDRARTIMYDHMVEAEKYMLERAAVKARAGRRA